MSTVQDIVDRVRVHLQEATANEFDDDGQLIPYINDGHRLVAEELSKVEDSGWFETEASLTVTANAASVALPANFLRVVAVEWLPSGGGTVELHPLKRSQMTDARFGDPVTSDGGPDPRYMLRDTTLRLLPLSTSARSLTLTYIYQPAALTDAADDLETPDRYDHVVALYAALIAAGDDNDRKQEWEGLLAGFLAKMTAREAKRFDSGHVETVSDDYTRAQYEGC